MENTLVSISYREAICYDTEVRSGFCEILLARKRMYCLSIVRTAQVHNGGGWYRNTSVQGSVEAQHFNIATNMSDWIIDSQSVLGNFDILLSVDDVTVCLECL